jgi:hypothetical protein
VAAAAAFDRASAGDELDEEDAEGVHVAAIGELFRAQVLGSTYPAVLFTTVETWVASGFWGASRAKPKSATFAR